MTAALLYYTLAALLFVGNALAWCATLLSMPGNWMIVALSAVFAWLAPAGDGRGISWAVVAVVAGLALLGEILEFLAAAAGAASRGASRRAVVLSVAGAIIGSIGGAIVGLPVPVIGSALGAIVGGGLGAFGGAYLGQQWKGRSHSESLSVGTAAFFGRLLGTLAKVVLGTIMLVIVTLDSLL